MKLRLLLGLCSVLAVGVVATTATADPTLGPPICSGAAETPIAGTFGNLVITGNRYVPSGRTLNTWGTLTVAPGACLDAFTMGTVHVGSSLVVGAGAILALGCTLNSPVPPCTGTTNDTVGGNIYADHPYTMYLDGDTVHGSVISIGGGPGLTANPYVNFPIKDNTIDGNLIVQGWHGAWVGVIRNTVGGNVIFSFNESVADSDSNEVQTNVIARNLICLGNSPAAQVNPGDGGAPNTVGGLKLGQCSGL